MFYIIKNHEYTWQRLSVSILFLIIGFYLTQTLSGLLSSVIFFLLMFIAFWVQYDMNKVKIMFAKLERSYEIKLFNKRDFIGGKSLIILTVALGFLLALLSIYILETAGITLSKHGLIKDPLKLLWILPFNWIGLIGEELLKCCILFPIIHFLSKKFGMIFSFVLATVITTTIFGLLHFNVYGGNIAQLVVVIGWSSLIWYYALYKTQSIRSVIWIHILHDYIIFILAIIGMLLMK
ncbi:CPBP family intramembrane glutamic endopeptidase [Staphylococcus shinii]|uniref:CPBP family intramembrane glutamic endopeptidase n=1 Tax=Staphylococcus shinii TaxID=2912228 RepID=UPI003F56BD72